MDRNMILNARDYILKLDADFTFLKNAVDDFCPRLAAELVRKLPATF